MIDRNAARVLAEHYLQQEMAQGTVPLVLLDEHTREEDFGWVFFYQSARFVETRNPIDRLAGNTPILVERDAGEVTTLSSAFPVDESIARYREERTRVGVIATDSILSALQRFGDLEVARSRGDLVEWRFAAGNEERDAAIARAVATFRGARAWAARRGDDGVWSLAPASWFLSGKSDVPESDAAAGDDRRAIALTISDTLQP